MKKLICTLLSVALMLSIAVFLTGCGAKLEEFKANEQQRYVEIGEIFSIPRPTAKDSKGNFLVPTVTAEGPDGKVVDVANFQFKPTMLGMYKITYTVTVGKTTESKSFDLEVYDETEPLVDIDLQWYNITVPGTTFDTKTVTATDNSGEAITPEVKVYFNDEEIELDNGVATFNGIGTYKIGVRAEDSSGNEEYRDYVVWTNVSYEDNVFVENQFYANSVSTDFARHGEKAMKIDLFGNQPTYNWFNDLSMLGEIYFYGNTQENPFTHVAYWIYFDFDGIDVNGTSSINGAWYDTTIYDIYGREVEKDIAQNKYTLAGDTWYRIVTDLNVVDNPVDHPEAQPITSSLMDYGIFFGLWDLSINSNTFSRPVQTYIDDIRIINPANDDEVYDEIPEPPAAKYEKGEKITHVTYSQMVSSVIEGQGADVLVKNGEEELVTYNFKHGMVEGTMSLFDLYSFTSGSKIGSSTDDGEVSSPDNLAFANGWQMYSGNNDAFIYEITAKKTVVVDLKAQVAGVDGAEANLGGWTDNGSGCKLQIYVKDADGNLEKLYSYAPNGVSGVDAFGAPIGYEVLDIVLEAGDTLYYEYSFPWQDHRNIQNPPYLIVYQANEKVA